MRGKLQALGTTHVHEVYSVIVNLLCMLHMLYLHQHKPLWKHICFYLVYVRNKPIVYYFLQLISGYVSLCVYLVCLHDTYMFVEFIVANEQLITTTRKVQNSLEEITSLHCTKKICIHFINS